MRQSALRTVRNQRVEAQEHLQTLEREQPEWRNGSVTPRPLQQLRRRTHPLGNTGNSFGAYLPFEVRVGGSPVDPLGYL